MTTTVTAGQKSTAKTETSTRLRTNLLTGTTQKTSPLTQTTQTFTPLAQTNPTPQTSTEQTTSTTAKACKNETLY